jgi:hypothetical protein
MVVPHMEDKKCHQAGRTPANQDVTPRFTLWVK